MNLSGVSSVINNQAVCGQTESLAAKSDSGNSTGWKYVTVQEGDTIYTYIVIGKNMKILIGQTSTQDEKDKKDEKTAGDQQGAAADPKNSTMAAQNNGNKEQAQNISFLIDHRMLGLTGFYQKEMRETLKEMEDRIVCPDSDKIKT